MHSRAQGFFLLQISLSTLTLWNHEDCLQLKLVQNIYTCWETDDSSEKNEITMFDYINKDLLLILAFSFSSIITDNHHNHLFTKKVTCNIERTQSCNGRQSTQQAWGVCDTMWKPQWPRCTKQLELKSLKTRDSYYVIKVLTTLLRENFYIVEVVRKDCHLQAAIIQRFLLSHPLQLHHHLLEQKDPTEFWQIFKREIWLQNREIQKSLPSADHHLSHQWKYP